ncbi:glycosyltransferase family protein, partial [Bifidobacterium pseudocatenulatum]
RNLKVLGNSFIKYRALNPSYTEINRIVVQNNVTGCTTMLSRDLLGKAFELEDVGEIAMHDWWFSLVASVFGHIVFVDKPTILYRQHGDNVVGATKVNSLSFILKRLSGNNHIKKTLHMAVDQAKVFLNTYQDIPLDDRSSLESFAKLYEYSKIQRILTLSKGHYWKQGPIQIIGEYIFI